MNIELRIFRQPTKDIQPNGEFYIDTLQYKKTIVVATGTKEGISGIPVYEETGTDWLDIPVVEADSY